MATKFLRKSYAAGGVLPPGATNFISPMEQEMEDIKVDDPSYLAKKTKKFSENHKNVYNAGLFLANSAGAGVGLLTGESFNQTLGLDFAGENAENLQKGADMSQKVTNTVAPMVLQAAGVPMPVTQAVTGATQSAYQMSKTPTRNGGRIKYAAGGELTEFSEGGTHEENPLGGIPVGQNVSVEEGETKQGNYVYSDTLVLDKETASMFNLPKSFAGRTYAEASKAIKQKHNPEKRVETEKYKEAISSDLDRLAKAQDYLKSVAIQQMENLQMAMEEGEGEVAQMRYGGKMRKKMNLGGDTEEIALNVNPPIDKITMPSLEMNLPPDNRQLLTTAPTIPGYENYTIPTESGSGPTPEQQAYLARIDANSMKGNIAEGVMVGAPLVQGLIAKQTLRKNKPKARDIYKFDIDMPQLNSVIDPTLIDSTDATNIAKSSAEATRSNIRATGRTSGQRIKGMTATNANEALSISAINADIKAKNAGIVNQAKAQNAQIIANNIAATLDVTKTNTTSRRTMEEANRADEAAYLATMMGVDAAIAQNVSQGAKQVSINASNPYQYNKYGKYLNTEQDG